MGMKARSERKDLLGSNGKVSPSSKMNTGSMIYYDNSSAVDATKALFEY